MNARDDENYYRGLLESAKKGTSPAATQASDDFARVRQGGQGGRARADSSHGLSVAIGQTGTHRPGASCRRTAHSPGALSSGEELRYVRLRSDPQPQQDAGSRTLPL